MQIAVLGTGIIGGGIAQNLLKSGFGVAIWNRTPDKTAALVEQGARLGQTPYDAAEGADVVLAAVGDDKASRAVWQARNGALAALKPGMLAIACSTLSREWITELNAAVEERGATLLDAPVAGSKEAAQNGQLAFYIGGSASDVERATPIFEAAGRFSAHIGPSGSGTTFKLLNNLMVAVQVASLAEALVMAEQAGLEMEKVLPLITMGACASPVVKAKAERIHEQDYADTHFALKWMRKDLSYALAAAHELNVALPTTASTRELYQMAINLGLGEQDFAAVAEALRQRSS